MQTPNMQNVMGASTKPAQPASPQAVPGITAGLGSHVQQMVNANKGNPERLEQQHRLHPSLMTALALEIIRGLQQSAQRQQALSAQTNPETVVSQIAQQVGATAQQDGQQKQQRMNQLMSGIAQAPGAATAAQPQAMAQGGIIGFAGGGTPEDDLDRGVSESDDRKSSPKKKRDLGRLRSAIQPESRFINPSLSIPSGGAGMVGRAARGLGSLAGRATLPLSALGLGSAAFDLYNTPTSDLNRYYYGEDRPPSVLRDTATRARAALSFLNPFGNISEELAAQRGAAPRRGAYGERDFDADSGRTYDQPTAMPAAPRPVTPAAPRSSSGAPAVAAPAAPAATTPTASPTLPEAPGIIQAPDPDVVRKNRTAEYEGKFAPTPEERRMREEGLGAIQKQFQQRFDPERMRTQGIVDFLLGAGGRRYNVLGGAETAAQEGDRRRMAEMDTMQERIRTLNEQGITERRAGLREATASGERGEQVATTRQGIEQQGRLSVWNNRVDAALKVFDVQERNRVAELARQTEIQLANARLASEAANRRLQADLQRDDREASRIARINGTIAEITQKYDRSNDTLRNHYQMELGSAMKSGDSKKIEAIKNLIDNLETNNMRRIEEAVAPLRRLLVPSNVNVISVSPAPAR